MSEVEACWVLPRVKQQLLSSPSHAPPPLSLPPSTLPLFSPLSLPPLSSTHSSTPLHNYSHIPHHLSHVFFCFISLVNIFIIIYFSCLLFPRYPYHISPSTPLHPSFSLHSTTTVKYPLSNPFILTQYLFR